MESQQLNHLEQHRELIRRYYQLRETNRETAHKFARGELEKAAHWSRNDPRRADALELISFVQTEREEFEKALVSCTEVVRIRKQAAPIDHELLALALGQQAIPLFALGRGKETEDALREQLEEWRHAFGSDDIEWAQKLESHAQYVQNGFGRTDFVVELEQEAARIRRRHPEAAKGKLAETLQQLAIFQMGLSDYGEAEANLQSAQELLEQEIARDPQLEEIKSALAQILVLRCGLAGVFAQKEQALGYAEAANNLKFENRIFQAEKEILVAAARSTALELFGDLPDATEEQYKILEVFAREGDMGGALDPLMMADAYLTLSALHLAQDEMDLAREALRLAEKQGGETSRLLFQRSALTQRDGNEAEALRDYQAALRLRKESATEMPVFFGTNRRAEADAKAMRFGGEPGSQVALGRAVVIVPGGQFSTDAWLQRRLPVPLPVGLATNPKPLFVRTLAVFSGADFTAGARKAMARARLYPKSALVFVHGYNVPFEDALKRGAQLARDLNYDGPIFVFSWPSRGNWWRYGTDRASADNAAASLAGFLESVAAASDARQIHIIAHSMGNRVLLPALATFANSHGGKLRPRIGEVIFAAPALPQREFADQLDNLEKLGLHRFTLYASSWDKAMQGGFLREWAQVLAGYVNGGRPLMHGGVDSIDLSEAGTIGLADLNHDVFASNPAMMEDIRQLLQKGQRPPDKRLRLLQPRPSPEKPEFWYYTEK